MVIRVFKPVQLPRLGHGRTDHGYVVPGVTAQRLGRLLQPRVIDKAAVVNGWIGPERDFNAISRSGRSRERSGFPANLLRSRDRVCDKTIMDRSAPESLKVARRVLRFPVRLDQIVLGGAVLIS